METKKSKVFTRKLIALFLSVLMALSCFTGALTAFAASNTSDKNYHDSNLASNFMAWAETTDEQTAEALLDYADLYLGDLMTRLLGSDHIYFSQNIVVATITIDAYLDSVDGLYDLIRQANNILDSYGGLVGGDVKNIDLSPIAGLSPATSGDYVVSKCGKSYRQNYSAKELIMALAKTLFVNSNDFGGKNVVGQFLKGSLDLGLLENFIGGNVYSLLQGTFGMWDGYQWNLVYNLVANIIINNTKWFTESEKETYLNDLKKTNASDRTYAWNFDDLLFKALNEQLLQKISVLVTYPNYVPTVDEKTGETVYVNDSSALRKKEGRIQDSKLVYSSEEQFANNVLLFVYDKNGDGKLENVYDAQGNITTLEVLTIEKDDNLFDFAFRALELAWETVLQDTLGLVHVNYNGHESVEGSVGSNYDNQFFYWMTGAGNRGWNYDNWKSNYSSENVQAWANAVYESYGTSSADEFLTAVKRTYEYDRNVAEDAKGNWHDIDSTSLFNKLRYSPLADVYFDMQTGPINLYFEQTGISSMSTFFDTAFTKYDSMVAAFNDALVAATQMIFMESDNIGYGTDENEKPVTNLTVPTMAVTNNTTDKSTVAATLVSNFMDMFEYAANAADPNILNNYYTNNNITVASTNDNLSETNFEEAMMPLLVACLNTPALDSLVGMIHDDKWDSAKDAEGVAIVALEEYLSYVLPDKDYSVLWTYDNDGFIVSKSDTVDLFNSAVLPMVRDALGYVISSTVPCRTKDGAEWNVYDSNPTDDTTIFEILNSVMCYYASTDNFSDGTTGKAVASLLGVVDANGNCLVSMDNDIWTNLDNIVNSLLPVIGTLQYGTSSKAGQASSKELIYDGIINGILDIGDVNEHSNKQGITNLIEQILTIVSADPISNQGVDVMVYDELVVPIVNNLFGARYTGQGYDKVIPYSSWYDQDAYADTKSSSPFDSLVTTSTLAHYSAASDVTDSNDTGIIGILICNIYEAFGGNSYSNAGTSGCWTGAMFAVEAVNNFIPSFVPQLSDHELNSATAEIAIPSQSGLTSSTAFTSTTLDITNNSMGLNRFYRDKDGSVKRDPRYFINVKSVDVTASNGNVSNITLGNATGVIAPEKTKKVSVSGNAPSGGVLYTFTVKYDIFKGEMNGTTLPTETADNLVESDLETIAYMYLTTDKNWRDTLYSRDYSDTVKEYDANYEPGSGSESTYTKSTAKGGTNNYLYATFPKSFIVPMSEPSSIENLGFRVRNDESSWSLTKSRAFDGVYTYLTAGTEYYAVNGKTMNDISDTLTTASADNSNYAYAAVDKTNGNILNYDLYDYYNPNTKEWVRGDVMSTGVHAGFTEAEINALDDSIKGAEGFNTRVHVAYTIDEAIATGYVKGVQRTAAAVDSNGNTTYSYEAVLFDLSTDGANVNVEGSGSSALKASTLLLQGKYANDSKKSISWGTPTAGIYLASGKTDVSKNSTIYTKFLNYDGTTALTADEYEMKVQVYTVNNPNMNGSIHMYIADDTGASTLTQAYNNNLNTVASYRAKDFTDYDGTTSETYESMKTALSAAVKTISTPVTTENAAGLGSKMINQAATETVTNELHKDIAYTPIPTSTALPAAIQAYATKGADGYWYYNEECTMPVYSNVELSGSNLTQDATGTPVALGEDGKYHIVNAPVYETAWDTTTYPGAPYRYETTTQSTDSQGRPLYKEISFVYRDANGNKVNSDDDWSYKLAETATVIKPNDGTDYRGTYQLDIDNLAYWLEQLQSKVDTAIANRIVNEVSNDREGLNNVNYEVASYEKMVQIARDAESLIWYEDTGEVDAAGMPVYEAVTNKSSLQIESAINMYNEFKGYVIPRGYIGNKLEAEISCATTPNYTASNKPADVYTYADFDYTQTVGQDAQGNDVVTAATVTSATAAEAEYGAWVDGALVNEGPTVYTDDSWNAYIIALSEAIKTADEGTAQVSKIYTVKTDLQRAENNLTEADAASDTITVSGKIVISSDINGNTGAVAIGGIDVLDAQGNVVATSAADGTFSAEVPAGTTELKISGPTTIDRTVTLTGTASVADVVIPVVIADYNRDTYVDNTDKYLFTKVYSGQEAYSVYYDYNGDGYVDNTDKYLFSNFYGNTIEYSPLSLD
ncbi:MAG: hypothetical protein ACLUFN_05820 [Eubacterium sp.]